MGGEPRGHVGRIRGAVGPPVGVDDGDRGLDVGVGGLELVAVGVVEGGGDVVGLGRVGVDRVQRRWDWAGAMIQVGCQAGHW